MATQQLSRARKITAWVLVGLITALILFSGFTKIIASGNPNYEIAQNFSKWGLGGGKLMLIGIGELIYTLLFLMPRTFSFGALILSAHFGGAIATHIEHGENYFPVVIIITLIWVAYYLRNPQMFASSFQNKLNN